MLTFDKSRLARSGVLVALGSLVAVFVGLSAGGDRPAAAGAPANFGGPFPISTPRAQLEVPISANEVFNVVQRAAEAMGGERLSVAVVDRRGAILASWSRAGATAADQELALSLARTSAYFGENQAPLTSRTVRYISGIHFPPGVRNQENADLYGIENTNRVSRRVTYNPDKEFAEPTNLDNNGPSLGISTGKVQPFDAVPSAVNPGGIPLYRQRFDRGFRDPTGFAPLGITQIGGVGIAGVGPDAAEFAGIQASKADEAPVPTEGGRIGVDTILRVAPQPKTVFVGGIALPLINVRNIRRPRGTSPGAFPGTGVFRIAPRAGLAAPDGFLVGPAASPQLTAGEVTQILGQCDAIARRTRAAIRLPLGSRARFIFAVGDLNGNMLGVYRQLDSTIFSLDVAITKARNAVFFSDPTLPPALRGGLPAGTAVTARTLNFASQPLFPAGIDGTQPGPYFNVFLDDLNNPGGTGPVVNSQPLPPGSLLRSSGIVWFPGSMPLYRNGVLVGGLGVSGDGVAQDDFVTFMGAQGFLPPGPIRSDNFLVRGVRMPFLKFPRNPTQ